MKYSDYLDVSQAPDIESFRTQVLRFANYLDFGLMSAILLLEQVDKPPTSASVDNVPAAWAEAFHSVEDGQRDPVLQWVQKRSTPIAYDSQTYADAAAGDLWEQQAAYGYRTGVATAVSLPHGWRFLLGFDREQALPAAEQRRLRLLADLQLLATHAQEAAMRLLLPAKRATAQIPDLSEREREVLRWIRDGKSRWAIGQILGVSENTVKFHLGNAMRKLEAGSGQAAALRAMTFKLI
ncbi:helix-turn-helix transcriptional regulator [Paucibacter soli]|uniref:helix-turn-helix transcriptional regulator n=1 Tax=Paucibacter soli TaxID=3133433 RepID=UPI0030982936